MNELQWRPIILSLCLGMGAGGAGDRVLGGAQNDALVIQVTKLDKTVALLAQRLAAMEEKCN
jgi:hypothetical protein